MSLNYIKKPDDQIPGIKQTRGRYEICKNENTGEYRLRRKATNGQILWNSETYKNKEFSGPFSWTAI